MGEIVKIEGGAHWYKTDGSPVYEVPAKSGGTKKTTLREARTMNLVPSVTTILKVIAAPALEAWKVEQGILASLTLPRVDGESEQDFAKRAARDADEVSRAARDRGTDYHRFIEDCLDGNAPSIDISAPDADNLRAVQEWISGHLTTSFEKEFYVDGSLGYSGRCDFYGYVKTVGTAYLDWKTQFVKDKPNFYDTWPLQLAAYREAHGKYGLLVSVIISTNPANPGVHVKVWEDRKYFNIFSSAFWIWQYQNNFYPGEGKEKP